MKLSSSVPPGLPLLTVLACISATARAHTWLEHVRLIASNGSYTGTPGFPRGFSPRGGSPDPDQSMVYRLDGVISSSAKMCNPQQTIGSNSAQYPPLEAAPGDQIAVNYLENGHVTKLEEGRPTGGGLVFVYGTKQPSNDDTYLGIHRVWNAEGTGGDKRGKLLATRHFDDGVCYQNNKDSQLSQDRAAAHPLAAGGFGDLSCQTNFKLPADAGTAGSYSIYWVWEWPRVTSTGQVIANESYTACVDINMTKNKIPDSGAFAINPAPESMAIRQQLRTEFLFPLTASQTLNTKSIFTDLVKTPVTTPVPSSVGSVAPPTAPAAPPAPGTSNAAEPQPTSAPQSFVTVTVTGPIQEKLKTVTVTDYIYGSPIPTQAVPTTSTLPAVALQPSGPPVVKPFLPAPGSSDPLSPAAPVPVQSQTQSPASLPSQEAETRTPTKAALPQTAGGGAPYAETPAASFNRTVLHKGRTYGRRHIRGSDLRYKSF